MCFRRHYPFLHHRPLVLIRPQSLHVCSQLGFVRSAAVLLTYGADANAQNGAGNTPLHVAVQRQHAELIECLLRFAAATNVPNGDGLLPFQMLPEYAQQASAARWMNAVLSFYISPAWAKHEPILTRQHRADIRCSFDAIDRASGDGDVDVADLQQPFAELAMSSTDPCTCSTEQLVAFRAWLDANGDGRVTYGDWFRWCARFCVLGAPSELKAELKKKSTASDAASAKRPSSAAPAAKKGVPAAVGTAAAGKPASSNINASMTPSGPPPPPAFFSATASAPASAAKKEGPLLR